MKKVRVLVTRFSAMGDVAMVASVLRELQAQNRQVELVMVSRLHFEAFFEDIPNLTFHPIFPEEQHKGPKGLWRLFQELKKYKIDYVADLHNNIRSKILTLFFKTAGYRLGILDKGRHQKKDLIKRRNKVLVPLRPTVERYADVFRHLGFYLKLGNALKKKDRPVPIAFKDTLNQFEKNVAVAPFAQHPYKVWKLSNWDSVFRAFPTHQFYIFGGGRQEQETAIHWSSLHPNVHSTIGKLSVSAELDLISNLDYMLSMDSSGMHMASLVGTRCLSIWGATHPYAGFLGYGQSINDCIHVEHPNRPSSIYGNKSCLCDGIEAIDLVSREMVIERIKAIL